YVSKLISRSQKEVVPWLRFEPIVFACAGQITYAKQIDKVLDAFKRLVDEGYQVRLKLIGESVNGLPLNDWIMDRHLQEFVTVTGFVDSTAAFEAELASAHVIINLREPTIGETSAVVVRALAQGRPVIVSDHGWYAELPECCPKVPPGSVDDLVEVMATLARDVEQIQQLGQQGLNLIKNEYAPTVVIKQFLAWLEQTIEKI
ncbi:MAG: glycosyltransferase, partial [Chloroflexota bacterium]